MQGTPIPVFPKFGCVNTDGMNRCTDGPSRVLPPIIPSFFSEVLSVTAGCMQVGPNSTCPQPPQDGSFLFWASLLCCLCSSAIRLTHKPGSVKELTLYGHCWPWGMRAPLLHLLPHPRVASQRSPAGDGPLMASSSCPFLLSLVPVSGPDPPNVPPAHLPFLRLRQIPKQLGNSASLEQRG